MLDPFVVLFECLREDDDVIQVHQTGLKVQARHHDVHETLERGRTVAKSELHFTEPERSSVADECRFVGVSRVHRDLMEPRPKIERAVPLCA